MCFFHDMKKKEVLPEQNVTEKVCGIIFSRDRAMQLDGLLRSLFLHCGDMDHAQITVLYKATKEGHARQYQKLAAEYEGRILFKEQQDFRRDTLSIFCSVLSQKMKRKYSILSALGSIGFSSGSYFDRFWRSTFGYFLVSLAVRIKSVVSSNACILFLVDDNIFVRDFLLTDIVNALETQDDLIGFSLRIGENTTYCYSQNHPQSLPNMIFLDEQRCKYDWTKSEYDFGYPLEVSSSVYRLKDMLPFMLCLPFENPNVLEGRMAFYAKKFAPKYSFLGCFRRSVTFCNPVNVVQSVILNRAGEEIRHDIDDLAVRFERGERIRIESYDNFIPNACHQEVEFVFEMDSNS